MYKFLLFIILYMCVSCSNNKQELNVEKVQTLNFRKDLELPPIDSLDWRFIKLETTDSCLFYGIRQIEFVDDKIIILDNKFERVLLFDITGKFIKQIGSRGSGPEEYVLPGKFLIDKKRRILEIIDFRTTKVLTFSLDNFEFVQNKYMYQPNYSDCVLLSDESIVWLYKAGYESGKRERYYLDITDRDYEHERYLCKTEYGSHYNIDCGSAFYQYKDEIYFLAPFSSIVYSVDENSIVPKYKVMFGDSKLPPENWLEEHLKEEANFVQELLKSSYISAYNLLETTHYFASTFYGKEKTFNIAFLDKKTNRSYSCEAIDFMEKYDLRGLGNLIGTYNDYFVSYLYLESWRHYSMKRDDLLDLYNQSTEFDNPIICLFKFK